jgi:hypothetical protein
LADTVEKEFLERATSIQETVHSDSIVARSGAGRACSRSGGPYGLGGRNVNEIERARIIHDGQDTLTHLLHFERGDVT